MNIKQPLIALLIFSCFISTAQTLTQNDTSTKNITFLNGVAWDLDASGAASSAANDRLGEAMAHGDFNGDGNPDLAIGIRFRNFILDDVGSVLIIYGNNYALMANNSIQLFSDNIKANDEFGRSLVAGDFNNDGFDDLVVGSPFKDFTNQANVVFQNTGAINVFYGTANGLPLNSVKIDADANDEIGSDRQAFAQFGSALSSGDYNQDGFDDLVVSAPNQDVNGQSNAGSVFIYYGGQMLSGNMGLFHEIRDLISQQSPGVSGSSEMNDFFGLSLSTGDYDNNGFDDLAIGVPFEAVGSTGIAGIVQVIYGAANGLTDDDEIWQQSTLNGAVTEAGDLFGYALASGDLNGDGFADLLIGAPLEDIEDNTDAGTAHYLPGTATGLSALNSVTFHQDSTDIFGEAESNDQFGVSLAAIDLDGDLIDEAIIGVPFEAFDGNLDSGFIHIIPGTTAGLDFAASDYISGESAGINLGWSMTSSAHYFGSSLIVSQPGSESNDMDPEAGLVLELQFLNDDIIYKDGFDFMFFCKQC